MTTQFKGASLIIISAVSFGTYGIWSRLMGHHFGEFSQAWTRAAILLPIVLITLWITKSAKRIKPKDLKWFAIIALAGGLNQAPYYYAFQHLTVGTATLLFYVGLVLGGYLMGITIFAEKLTRPKLASLILAIAGVSVIYRFTLDISQIIPASLSLVAGIMGAAAAVMPKKLSSDYPEVQIMAGYFIVMLIANGIFSQITQDATPAITNYSAWIPQLAYAAALLLANATVIAGFKYISAISGTLLGTLEIVFAVIAGIIFFDETLEVSFFIGTTLILTAIALPLLIRPHNRFKQI